MADMTQMDEGARTIKVTVNGAVHEAKVSPRVNLADFLRETLKLTGTHVGCEHGVCGACTVIVDGRAVRSCLTLAVQADGTEIETIESLGSAESLSELQRVMRDEHALQCGFCTPGILMSIVAAERENLPVDEVAGEILGGHVCRCTGYQNIRTAIERHWASRGHDD